MAYVHSKQHVTNLDDEIILTAVMIKNIPLNWNTSHLLHLMSQINIPTPRGLNYLYDNSEGFRGMAFADFATPAEAWQVIQELNYYRVSGGKLKVQYKKKQKEMISRESIVRRKPFRTYHHSHSSVRDEPHIHPLGQVSPAPRPTRQQTPSSESYDLLMSYQTEPLEKEKLGKFLAQTGDYQEAINEFAKNRVWESQEERYQRSLETGERPILEMRPATPGELQQIADMESWFGLDGAACSKESLTRSHEGYRDTADETGESKLESINTVSLEKKGGTKSQRAELDERKNKEDIQEGRFGDAVKKPEGIDERETEIR